MRAIVAFLTALLIGPAFADETINNLTPGSALSGTEAIPMFQGSNPATSTTPNAIKTFVGTGVAGVSSISTACGATSTGGPSTGAVTVSSLETPSTVTSGNYSTSNCGNVVYYNSASDQSPTIPLAATAGAGAAFKTCSVQHSQTVTASGSDNIGATGAATTISLPTGTATAPSCIEFTSDGTSRWTPLPYGGSGSERVELPQTDR